MLLKEKHNGDIKIHEYLDVRKQRETMKKEDEVSTTVATESLFITTSVDANEG